jgi:hypothetical protein
MGVNICEVYFEYGIFVHLALLFLAFATGILLVHFQPKSFNKMYWLKVPLLLLALIYSPFVLDAELYRFCLKLTSDSPGPGDGILPILTFPVAVLLFIVSQVVLYREYKSGTAALRKSAG